MAQKSVYFVRKVLQGPENRYAEIEKAALAVMTTVQKLRPYFLSHLIKVRTTLSFKQTLGRPDLSGQMVKWAVELGEYEVEFEPRTTMKVQALADFPQETTRVREKKEWRTFVYGSITKVGVQVRVRILTLKGDELKFAIHFICSLSNNEAEYEAVLNTIQMLVTLKAEDVVVFNNSILVAQQVLGNFEVKEDRMFQYIRKIRKEAAWLTSFHIEQIDREENKEANELARLASSLSVLPEGKITILKARL